jgi:hypothetical protein
VIFICPGEVSAIAVGCKVFQAHQLLYFFSLFAILKLTVGPFNLKFSPYSRFLAAFANLSATVCLSLG